MTLSTRVLLGLAAGVAAGLFFGEWIAFIGIAGDAFILLLQMAVLPYVAVSLVSALGGLSYAEVGLLARKAGTVLLVLWGMALSVVLLVPLAFPDWESASFFSSALISDPPPFDFLSLFIPANPFHALASNVVPAVVVFSVALGLALIGVEHKHRLVDVLSTLNAALGRITAFVVRLAPYGVFAISARAAGTMQPDQFQGLTIYLTLYAAVALLLTFWTFPMLVTTITPFRYRDVVGSTRDALITALATGSVFVVLPVLAAKSKKLLQEVEGAGEEAESLVDVVVPASFNFPSSGKLLGLMFVPFAGWLSGFGLSLGEYPALAVAGFFTFFGSSYSAIPLLLDLFRIPADTFSLFVVTDSVVGGRFGALLAAMHILALTLLSASSVAGLIRVQWAKLLRYIVLTAALTAATLGGVRLFYEFRGHEYEKYHQFVAMRMLTEPVEWSEVADAPEPAPTEPRDRPVLERIRERGVLRVGYGRDALPFAFRNEAGELVGLDVEMAHTLAREIGVGLQFVRVRRDQLAPMLEAGYLDIAMSGLAVTPGRMETMAFTDSYIEETLAFIVEDHRTGKFNRRAAVKKLEGLKIAAMDVPYYVEKVREYLPTAEVQIIASPREFFRQEGQEFDALIYGARAGSAWSLVYPQFSVAVPQPDVLSVPLAYAVAKGEDEMVGFLDTWIGLKRRDGTIKRLTEHWILGQDPKTQVPRWSVIRDVLHWVD